jgi:hypothetical protein
VVLDVWRHGCIANGEDDGAGRRGPNVTRLIRSKRFAARKLALSSMREKVLWSDGGHMSRYDGQYLARHALKDLRQIFGTGPERSGSPQGIPANSAH